jgi:hypothetical protein
MACFDVLWTADIVEHLVELGVSQDDFECVLCTPSSKGLSRLSGLPAPWGYTQEGRYIMVVYDELDDTTILPVTAYEVPEPR